MLQRDHTTISRTIPRTTGLLPPLLLLLFLVCCCSFHTTSASSSSSSNTCYTNSTLPLNATLSQSLATCCWYDQASCCDNSTSLALLDAISTAITELATNQTFFAEPSCYEALSALECMPCAPNTADFYIGNTSIPSNATVCWQTCNTIYSACERSINQTGFMPGVVDGRSLCLYLHRATDGFIISDTINCFELPDGFPASVGNSTCLPEQYAPSHRQLSSTVIILIVVVPLCFALVVVVVAIASWAHYRKRTNYLMIDETTPIRKASSMSSDRS